MKVSLFTLLAVLLFNSTSQGGGVNFIHYHLSGGSYPEGAAFTSVVSFDNTGVSDAQGWSFGVCHDSSAVTLLDVESGSTTETVNGGASPAFYSLELLPDGYTQGVVIDFFGVYKLEPGLNYEFAVASYSNDQVFPASTMLNFCSTLGLPPVENVIVFGGASLVPDTTGATIETLDLPLFIYSASNETAGYSNGPPADVTVSLSIEGNPASFGPDIDTQGLSMGVEHDPTFLSANSIDLSPALSDLNGGMGPSFVSPTVFANGVTLGVVYQFLGGVFIRFDGAIEVATVNYSVDISSLSPSQSANTSIIWSDALGLPAVANVVVADGASLVPAFVNGDVYIIHVDEPSFVRGDCNGDALIDVADGIWILNELFQGGQSSSCQSACDANDDLSYDQSDAVFIFSFQFLGGAQPPAPFPNCGDPAGSDCDSSSCL